MRCLLGELCGGRVIYINCEKGHKATVKRMCKESFKRKRKKSTMEHTKNEHKGL